MRDSINEEETEAKVDIRQHGSSGLLGTKDFDEDETIGLFVTTVRESGSGVDITIENTLKDPKDLESDIPDFMKERDFDRAVEIENKILEYIRDNPKKVSLGYGPTHPLDEIEPVSKPPDYDINSTDQAINDFNNWIKEAIKRTEENLAMSTSHNEHGFYVDSANNTVGIVEGSRKHISYPPRVQSEVLLGMHTHPQLESAAVPSKADILSFMAQGKNAYNIIASASNITWIYNNKERWEDAKENIPDSIHESQFRPFNSAPAVMVKNIDADLIPDVDEYIKQYRIHIQDIIEQQFDHKHRVIVGEMRGAADDDIVEAILDRLEDSEQALKDRMEGDSPVLENLRQGIETYETALQVESKFIKYR